MRNLDAVAVGHGIEASAAWNGSATLGTTFPVIRTSGAVFVVI